MRETLISKIADKYGLIIKSLNLLREGSDNRVFVLKTRDGTGYVVRISKRNVSKDVLFELNFINFLVREGIAVPEIIKTKDGELFALIDDLIIVLFEFVDGHHIEVSIEKKPDLSLVSQAASVLAKIHNASSKIKTLTFLC